MESPRKLVKSSSHQQGRRNKSRPGVGSVRRPFEALFAAEERDGHLTYAGQVRFGFTGKGLWAELDRLRAGPPRKGVVPVEPVLRANIKFFGRRGRFIRGPGGAPSRTEPQSRIPQDFLK